MRLQTEHTNLCATSLFYQHIICFLLSGKLPVQFQKPSFIPLHNLAISLRVFLEFHIFFLKCTLSEVSCVILQMRFWGFYIIYPFALFRDTIFIVPSDYQKFIDCKMQHYILYIELYPVWLPGGTWDSLLTSLYLVQESRPMANIKSILISASKKSFWQYWKTLEDNKGLIYYTLRKNVPFFDHPVYNKEVHLCK
jgi:hypothetical protein